MTCHLTWLLQTGEGRVLQASQNSLGTHPSRNGGSLCVPQPPTTWGQTDEAGQACRASDHIRPGRLLKILSPAGWRPLFPVTLGRRREGEPPLDDGLVKQLLTASGDPKADNLLPKAILTGEARSLPKAGGNKEVWPPSLESVHNLTLA